MKQLAVHLHIYYTEQLPNIIKYLKNLEDVDYDLFVTVIKEDKFLEKEIKSFNPNANIKVVENRGYDVGPFIDFLHTIDLDNYEYILKLHTKHLDNYDYGCFNGVRVNCTTWSKMLYDSLLSTKDVVANNLSILTNEPDVGMIGSSFCTTDEKWTYQSIDKQIQKEAQKINLTIKDKHFVAGTMFLTRAKLLKPFLAYKITDFISSSSTIKDYTLAHCLERLFGWSIYSQGHKIKGVKNKNYYLDRCIAPIMRTFIQKKITKSGKIIVKVCKMPIYSKLKSSEKHEVEQSFSIQLSKHKRLAIYAAYDDNGEIDASDLMYIKELKKVADNVIYIADSELKHNEEEKIRDLVCHIEARKHGEYDFGSYKIGFEYAKNNGMLEEIDELILCNDSCYAPVHPFATMFDEMKNRKCDFWGITENIEFHRHIQSYFMVFRPRVFNSEVFYNFIKNIKAQKDVFDVIQNYELGLSQILFENKFIAESYIGYPKFGVYPLTLEKGFKNLTAAPVWLMEKGCPIIKKKAFIQKIANYEGGRKTRKSAVKYNKKLCEVLPSKNEVRILDYQNRISEILRFFYQKKITRSGKILIKICKIPVYSKVLNNE